MFNQIKTEPIQFFQSSCPSQLNQQQHQQATSLMQQTQIQNQQHVTVITINEDKDSLQVRIRDKLAILRG
jgi:hypothetical protein